MFRKIPKNVGRVEELDLWKRCDQAKKSVTYHGHTTSNVYIVGIESYTRFKTSATNIAVRSSHLGQGGL